MLRSFAIGTALFASASAAEQRSGNATAEWLTSSQAYAPGQPLETALRLKVDPGWHTYWLNPGEGGMKPSFQWQLPTGWKAAEPAFPVPIRFFTGDLPGFGYEGEFLLPVTLTPPADASGPAELTLAISWLTCDDSACVPGDVELKLNLSQGEPAPTADAPLIADAARLVPKPLDGLVLTVSESGPVLTLRLHAPGVENFDPAKCEIFPQSVSTVDDGKPIQFARDGEGWAATAAKSPYLEGPVKELTLVIAGDGAPRPVEATWKIP